MTNDSFFQSTLNSLVDGVVVVEHKNETQLVSFVNRAFTEITGYSTDELVGLPVSSILPRVGNSGLVEVKGKDGIGFWAEIHTSKVFEISGKSFFTKTLRDQTEKVKIARLGGNWHNYLGSQEGMLKSVIENVPGVIFQWVEEPDGTYHFTYVSPKIKEIFGVKPEEMDTLISYLTPEDRHEWRRSVEEANIKGIDWRYEGKLVYPDGTVKWWQGLSHKALVKDGAIFYNGVMLDITEKKELEMEVDRERQSVMQASKMAMLGEMATGIAHEINNPLTVIVGLNHELRSRFDKGTLTPEFFRNHCEKIDSSTYRIATIVGSLKDFARDSSREPVEKKDIRVLIRNAVEILSPKISAHPLEVRLDLPESPVFVFCRPTQIEQVVINLVSNAIDAVNSLPEKWVRISLASQNDSVLLRVTDSGKGISESIQQRMMAPFFTTKEVGKGTGLGLSVSDGIVRSHSGTLALDSNYPNTSFTVVLPRTLSGAVSAK